MANTLNRQLIRYTSSGVIVKLTIEGDGSGDESLVLVNVTGALGVNNTLKRVQACFSGFSGALYFDASTPLMACQLPSDALVDLDFMGYGIPNNAGTGKTGDVKITTSGLGNGDTGFLIIEMVN